ncbi:hypothetical protein [uncultured Bradyrhizobium sp.]|uniref:hypothetical protein n=1 Tax=uncultured Bradyrhizobium sp. TaxID=199684 RepID=UPI002638ECA3|nr:hypothetical protein [uncultured Bradyrhizobium sp.]
MQLAVVRTDAIGRRGAVSRRRIVVGLAGRGRRWRRPVAEIGRSQIGTIERPGSQRILRSGDFPVPAVPAAVERRPVGGSRQTQIAVPVGIEHRRQEQDLGVEPLIDLPLHEAMQDERDQDCGDDERDGDEHAGSDHQASAE